MTFITRAASTLIMLLGITAAATFTPIALQVVNAYFTYQQEGVYVIQPYKMGGQEEINDCKGPVNMEWNDSYYAEHWHCGGFAFPTRPGSIVQNADTNETFIVQRILTVVPEGSSNTVVPDGYDMYYQTCLDGNSQTMGIVGLKKIAS